MSTFNYSFKKISVPMQIFYGISFGLLNLLINSIAVGILKIPFYMDTIFTVVAGFFSLPCGLICAVTYHMAEVIIKYESIVPSWFGICSITVALISWLFARKEKEFSIFTLLFLSVLLIIIISIEGGIIYDTFYAAKIDFVEDQANNLFTFSLIMNKIPLLWASIISRIPVSIVDKTVAVFGGFFIAKYFNAFSR